MALTSPHGPLRATRITLVVEPNPTGHRLSYVRLLADAAISRGDRVVFATTTVAVDSDEFRVFLEPLGDSIDVVTIPEATPSAIEKLVRATAAQLAVVPDGDRFAMRLGARGRWRGEANLSVLIMRDPVSARSGPRKILKTVLLGRAARLAGVNLYYLRSAVRGGSGTGVGVFDPVHISADSSDAQRLKNDWGLDDRFWFGILGVVDARKNLPLVLDALTHTTGGKIGLLVAGKSDPATLRAAETASTAFTTGGGEVVVVNRMLSDRELDAALLAVDCVVLAHSNEGPSGMLGKAAAAGVMVAAAGALSLKSDVAELGDRAMWSPLEPTQMARMFAGIVAKKPAGRPIELPSSAQFAETLLR